MLLSDLLISRKMSPLINIEDRSVSVPVFSTNLFSPRRVLINATLLGSYIQKPYFSSPQNHPSWFIHSIALLFTV